LSDHAYDDGSEVEVETEQDDPPSSGQWVDPEEFIHNPTDEEVAEGERLGNEIDIDDDEDNGL
jgi:hypothetical protein